MARGRQYRYGVIFTEKQKTRRKISILGEVIRKIGLMAVSNNNFSATGLVIQLQ